ncbi:geranylgeranyl diphosphate synthase type I [Actinopolyspora biskrensis]|uniref:Geranylgeranyl diphosphate synthase type I n=1 Tax=Actinopolyspora biskrensis TaxID=1470178 RepID=A0A852YPR7_9ACTN|nr:polyprenyl synthetase family protein [Actinopolyspora biskrensis]NYH76741.1 geranylgeranyl diphosphate synthase type I [Actinopolyspora biskrensis]
MPLEDLVTGRGATEVAVDDDIPEQVRQTLADYLRIRVRECGDLDPAVAGAAEELVDFVLRGGKRIRPTFAWWGWRAGGGSALGPEATAMLRAASSLELIQAGALMHDDLIDGSATRRGSPTVHVRFSEFHREHGYAGEPRDFGLAAAVLLGDLALSWADDMLRSAGLASGALARALGPWQAMRTEVLAGQYLDMLGQARADETPEAALRIDELKAASYTVQRPLEFGAETAGADRATLGVLRRFGADIGVAFQLRDDLLGVFGDPEVTGKPAGDDLREGKRTLLVAEGMLRAKQQSDETALELLETSLGEAELTREGVQRVRDALDRLGAVEAVEKRIGTLTESALSALHEAELPEPAARALERLTVTVTDRDA